MKVRSARQCLCGRRGCGRGNDLLELGRGVGAQPDDGDALGLQRLKQADELAESRRIAEREDARIAVAQPLAAREGQRLPGFVAVVQVEAVLAAGPPGVWPCLFCGCNTCWCRRRAIAVAMFDNHLVDKCFAQDPRRLSLILC